MITENYVRAASVGKNFIKIEQELTLEYCFQKLWFYKKYIVKNHFVRTLLTRDCTFNKIINCKKLNPFPQFLAPQLVF